MMKTPLRILAGCLALMAGLSFVACSSDSSSSDEGDSSSTSIKIVLNKASTSILTAATETLSATISGGTTNAFRWYSRDTAVAKVADTGLVTAVAPGKTQIVAVSTEDADSWATCVVTVTNEKISVSGFSFTSESVYVNNSSSFTATIEPSDATNQNIEWTSSDEAVATVSCTGLVTGLAAGTTTITAVTEDGSITDSEEISVEANLVDSITISSSSTSVAMTKTLQLTASVSAKDTDFSASNSTLTWNSSSPAIATVNSTSGLVTGVSPGSVTVTASASDGSGVSGTFAVTVTQNYVASISIPSSYAASVGDSAFTLSNTVTGVDSSFDATDSTLVWSSSSTGVAAINAATGAITPLAIGTTTITATASDRGTVTATCTLRVISGTAKISNLASAKGIGKVVLSWTNPSDSFDHLIVSNGTTTTSVSSSLETCTVTGLSAGTEYTFSVTAVDTNSDPVGPSVSITDSPFFTSLTNVPALTSIPMGGSATASAKTVTSLSAYSIGTTELSYADWKTVTTWATSNGYTISGGAQGGGYINSAYTYNSITTSDYQPVTGVTWVNAAVWCNAASAMDGLEPVYFSNAALTTELTSNSTAITNIYMSSSANGYRLPTEAEWEAAATYIDGSSWNSPVNVSGDTSGAASTSSALGNYCWYYSNSVSSSYKQTHNVGTTTANALGLYDMSGNVWEQVWDWYTADYSSYTEANTTGPSTGTAKVYKGGQFYSTSTGTDLLPGTHSTKNNNTSIYYYIGFRLAMTGNH